MSQLLIQKYLNPLATLKKVSGSTYEGVVREACDFSVERRLCHSAGTKSATAHLRSRANVKAPNPGAPKRIVMERFLQRLRCQPQVRRYI
jgi:hypothetical protein